VHATLYNTKSCSTSWMDGLSELAVEWKTDQHFRSHEPGLSQLKCKDSYDYNI